MPGERSIDDIINGLTGGPESEPEPMVVQETMAQEVSGSAEGQEEQVGTVQTGSAPADAPGQESDTTAAPVAVPVEEDADSIIARIAQSAGPAPRRKADTRPAGWVIGYWFDKEVRAYKCSNAVRDANAAAMEWESQRRPEHMFVGTFDPSGKPVVLRSSLPFPDACEPWQGPSDSKPQLKFAGKNWKLAADRKWKKQPENLDPSGLDEVGEKTFGDVVHSIFVVSDGFVAVPK